MYDLREPHHKAFAMLREGYNKEWKKHTPSRAKLSKKEDIAFVRRQKQKIFERSRAIDKLL